MQYNVSLCPLWIFSLAVAPCLSPCSHVSLCALPFLIDLTVSLSATKFLAETPYLWSFASISDCAPARDFWLWISNFWLDTSKILLCLAISYHAPHLSQWPPDFSPYPPISDCVSPSLCVPYLQLYPYLYHHLSSAPISHSLPPICYRPHRNWNNQFFY